MKSFNVGEYSIKDDSHPIVTAEIGINHNGSLELAKQMVEKAVASGADMVKLQSFKTDRLLAQDVDYYAEIKNLSFSFSQQKELFQHAQKCGAVLFSAPFDTETADLLDELGVPAFKIASMDCNNIPLLRHVGKKGKPVFLATGMADMDEISLAVDTLLNEGNDKIVLMHCVADYPTKPEDINLNTMTMLGEKFGLPFGFSDHSPGITNAVAAARLGASVIEKHFALDRKMAEQFPYSDYAMSIEPDEMFLLSQFCRDLPAIMGRREKVLSTNERNNRDRFRRGIYATRDLERGETLNETDCIPLRPLRGISVSRWDMVIGTKLKRPVKTGSPITADDLENFVG